MGHDSERAAMIYLHEARGADKAITDAIDAHLDDARKKDADAMMACPALSSSPLRHANGTTGLAALERWSASADQASDWGFGWSGRRESNPHDQLGRLGLCH